MLLRPGDYANDYELVCPLSQGGMGAVWVARLRRQNSFERLVALKMSLPHLADDERMKRMMIDEARIASRIHHPSVAATIDLGERQGIPYFVMEWVNGCSLRELDRAARKLGEVVPLAVLVRSIVDAAAGIHAAHELRDAEGRALGVVHRDVSPQNVLFTRAGTTKVIDFGVAKARGRLAEETASGSIKGKIRFMSPEQAVGAPGDRRVDVWGLAAVLYFMVTGAHVHERDTDLAVLQALASGTAVPPLPDAVPEAIRRVVANALAPRAEDRTPTAKAFGDALEEACEGARVLASPGDVARCIEALLGPKLDARDEALRQELARLDAVGPPPTRAVEPIAVAVELSATARVLVRPEATAGSARASDRPEPGTLTVAAQVTRTVHPPVSARRSTRAAVLLSVLGAAVLLATAGALGVAIGRTASRDAAGRTSERAPILSPGSPSTPAPVPVPAPEVPPAPALADVAVATSVGPTTREAAGQFRDAAAAPAPRRVALPAPRRAAQSREPSSRPPTTIESATEDRK